MATRFYLPTTGTTTITPAFDAAWDDSSSVVRRPANTTKGTSAFAEVTDTEVSTSNTWDVCLGQFISEPLQAQTITGTVKGIIRTRESAAGANARSQMVVRVVSSDGLTVRGTLIAQDNTTTNINEWVATTTVTAARNARFPVGSTGTTVTSVAAQAGDRIVIEVGGRAVNTVATSFTLGLRFGENAVDAVENETGVTEAAPWVEFSQTLLFADPVYPAAFVHQGQQPQVPARINWSHPLARGLVFLAIPNPQNAADLVGGGRATPLNATGFAAGTGGVGLNSTSVDNTGWSIPYRADLFHSIGTELTVACHVDVTVQDAYSTLISVPYVDNQWMEPFGSIGLARSGTNTNINLGVSDSTTNRNIVEFANDTFLVGPGQSIMVTRSGTTGTLYRNTVSFGSQFSELSALPVVHGTPGVVVLMNRSNTMQDEGTVGVMYYAAFWNRALSAGEALSFQRDPYQILIPASSSFITGLSVQASAPPRTGTSSATLPKATASAAATRTIPARTATSASTLPKATTSATATRTIPARTAASVAVLPKTTTSATASRTVPAGTATSASTLPKPTATTAATRTIPARTATSASTLPNPSTVAAGSRTVPGRTAASSATLPKAVTGAAGSTSGGNRLASKPAGTLTLTKSGILANTTGYWAFQEASGVAVNLANPGTGDATLQSAASRGPDAIGGAYLGAKNVASYATTGLTATALGIGGTVAKTVFCRFSASSQAYANDATLGTYTGALFYCGSGVTNGAWAFRQASPTNPPSNLWLANLNASPAPTEITITPTVDTVHTLVMVWDGTTNVRVYVDGILAQTIPTAINTADDRTFDIGRMLPNSGVDADRWHFQGKIYELGVVGGTAWSASDAAAYDANPTMGLSGTTDGGEFSSDFTDEFAGIASTSEFTNEFTNEFAGTSLSADSSSRIPQPTTAASGSRTTPARTATAASTLPKSSTTSASVRTIPNRTATSASTLPKATALGAATRTIPARTATSASTLPKATSTATAARTIPNRAATSSSILPKAQSLTLGFFAQSSSDEYTSEFTSEFANGTTPKVGSSVVFLPATRTEATASRTIPNRTAASAATLPTATTASTAVRTPPVRTATSSATTPKPTSAASATRTIPTRNAASSAILPKATATSAAARTIPALAATGAAILPKTTASGTATRTIPVRTANSSATTPKVATSASAVRTIPARTATSAVTLPKATAAGAAARTIPARTAASVSTLPKSTSTATASRTIPLRTATSASTLPKAQSLTLGSFVQSSSNEFTTEYTSEFANGTVPVVSSSIVFLPKAATTAAAVRTIPARTATSASTLPKAVTSAAAVRTPPVRTATSASTAPKAVSTATSARSIPGLAGTSSATLPKPTASATASRTIPARTATSPATLPKTTSAASAARTIPGCTGASASTLPKATGAATAVRSIPGLAGTSSTVLPRPTASATAARTIPARTATSPATLPKATSAATALLTIPSRTGTSVATLPKAGGNVVAIRSAPGTVGAAPSTLPKPTTAVAAARTIPNRVAASSAVLPKPTTAATAARTLPGTASSTSTLSKVRTTATGSRTIPDLSGASASVIPFPRSSATATRLPLPVTATSASTLPSIFTVAVGLYDVPLFTGSSQSRLPRSSAASDATFVRPQFTGQAAGTLPLLGTLAQGRFISPSAADVAGVVHLTGMVVYDIELTGEVITDIDLQGEVITA